MSSKILGRQFVVVSLSYVSRHAHLQGFCVYSGKHHAGYQVKRGISQCVLYALAIPLLWLSAKLRYGMISLVFRVYAFPFLPSQTVGFGPSPSHIAVRTENTKHLPWCAHTNAINRTVDISNVLSTRAASISRWFQKPLCRFVICDLSWKDQQKVHKTQRVWSHTGHQMCKAVMHTRIQDMNWRFSRKTMTNGLVDKVLEFVAKTTYDLAHVNSQLG